ncbi:response regulator transcription factor [Erysipelothrix sp. HDW6C]|uniref:response regulator transcription factor n=1 Tax=Erysipelothrix sp. HDW6C TaxID=2714930 RepID=UPI0014081752|nr:response regulator transcription factor [Erysipelothrix sp. HDW6C]QIK69180.1 response regulator transcription factor [Erysipelothrix sp. HDW6C]
MSKILLVEDNPEYLKLLERILTRHDYDVDTADNSITGMEMLAKNKYDLLVSDLYLDTVDGIKLTASAKNIDPDIKTIILTGNPAESTEMEALMHDVDLYLEKSKSMNLVLKYIEVVLNSRTITSNKDVVLESKSQNLTVNLKTHEVTKDDEVIDLTPIEFHIIQMFLERKNEKLTREDIIETVWGGMEVVPRIIDVHIKNIRDKLNIFAIVTVRGYGYKWNEKE